MSKPKLLRLAAIAVLTLAAVTSPAWAALQDLGPAVAPHGFPEYYRDANNLSLEPCLPEPIGPAGGQSEAMCIFDPADPANPLGVGDEIFWWMAEAQARPLVAGGKALLTLALEGAFGGAGVAQDGQQIAFGRIRIRIDVPVAGTYTVTHPFGTRTFENVTVAEGINLTEDLGTLSFLNPEIGFRGALNGQIGPFLTWPDFDNPEVNPSLQITDPDTGELIAQYVGDPTLAHGVSGSTFIPAGESEPANYFRIQGPNGIDERTDLFTVMGRVFDSRVERTPHVYPEAPPQNLFAVGPVNRADFFAEPSAGEITGVAHGGYPTGFPLWYQERVQVEDPDNPGSFIDQGGLQLTICPAVDPMCISAPIDPADPASVALGVGEEAFWWTGEAFINDRTEDVADPQGIDALLVLAVEGAFGGAGGVNDGDQIGFGRVRIRVDVPVAGTYTITHPYGTEVFEDVTLADGINFTGDIGIIDPSDPDGGFAGALYGKIGPRFLTWPDFDNPLLPGNETLQRPVDPNDPASLVQYVGDPTVPHGVVGSSIADAAHPSGFQNYFRVQGPGGIDVRTNLFAVTGKVFDEATFQVLANPNAPVALDDAATVESGGTVLIDVLANDTLGGSPVDPAAVTLSPATTPVGAVGPFDGTVQLSGSLFSYTSTTPGFAGSDSFVYTVTDTATGLVSNSATVTLTVLPVETMAVTRAQLDLRRLEWRIQGTHNIDGTTLTVHAGPDASGPVIGTALVSRGRWQLRTRSTVNPGVTSISIVTSTGKTLLAQPLRVR